MKKPSLTEWLSVRVLVSLLLAYLWVCFSKTEQLFAGEVLYVFQVQLSKTGPGRNRKS